MVATGDFRCFAYNRETRDNRAVTKTSYVSKKTHIYIHIYIYIHLYENAHEILLSIRKSTDSVVDVRPAGPGPTPSSPLSIDKSAATFFHSKSRETQNAMSSSPAVSLGDTRTVHTLGS